MIQLKSILNVIDNTGAKLAECVNVIGGRKRIATVGDEIVCVIKKATPIPQLSSGSGTAMTAAAAAQAANRANRGDVKRAVVCRVRKEFRRMDGTYVRFDDNACVLLNNKKEPLGNRIQGPIAHEVRMKKFAKVASLAPKLI